MSKCNGPQLKDPGPFPSTASTKEKKEFWDLFHRHRRSFQYEEICKKCKAIHYLETQEDGSPEYYTDVYLKCPCGEYVKFDLPVN